MIFFNFLSSLSGPFHPLWIQTRGAVGSVTLSLEARPSQGGAGQKKGRAGQGGGRQKRKELVEDTVAAHKREQQCSSFVLRRPSRAKRGQLTLLLHIRAHGWPTA